MEIGFVNELLNKKRLVQIIATAFRKCGNLRTAQFLDELKTLGFMYATKGGLSVSVADVAIPKEKEEMINKSLKDVDSVERQYQNGFITNGERYNKVIDIWTRTTSRVAEKLFDSLQHSREGFNSLYMMIDSGARGSKEQVRQLAGMRGLDGEAAEIALRRDRRVDREPDHCKFPRRTFDSRVLHLDARST